MKNKTVAGVLALMGGYAGIHRFYLGQVGLGMAYILLLPIFLIAGLWAIPFIVGFVDAAKFLSMDQAAFDEKYNGGDPRTRGYNRGKERARRQSNRSERRQERSSSFPPQKRKPNKAATNKYLKAGIDKFKDYDFEEAISLFNQALKGDPKNAAVHFNLGCAYSLTENKDKAFYHLDRAVALGLDDFDILKTRDHLAYVRIQPEWQQFEANGFRLAQQINAPKAEGDLLNSTPKAEPQELSGDLLEELQQLATLKKNGLLTEAEFRIEKEKLLG